MLLIQLIELRYWYIYSLTTVQAIVITVQRTMLFLVRLSVTILCGTIMVVKSEAPECTLKGPVVWCKNIHYLNDLQGLITENTTVLMLEDTRGLSEGKSLDFSLENADKVRTIHISKNQDVNKDLQVISIFSNLGLFEVTNSRWTLIKTGTFSGKFMLRVY